MSEAKDTFEMRVSRLGNYISRAFKYNKPSILFAMYMSEFLRADVEKSLEKSLKKHGLRFVDVDAGKNKDIPSLISSMNSDNTVFLVHNMAKGFPEVLQFLNFKREELIEHHVKAVFWVKEKELARISEEAPDFFAFRNRVVEFLEVPSSDAFKEFALETEYESLDEIKRSIELKEKLLLELSGKDEISGYLLGALGILYNQIGSSRTSIDCSEKALKIAREIGDRKSEGVQLGNIGNAYRILGDMRKSIEYYEEALAIAREIEDQKNEGIWLGNLGISYRLLGNMKEAIQYNNKALAIAQEMKDRRNESRWLTNIGLVHRDIGNVIEAKEYYEKALKIAQEIGNRRFEGRWLNDLGEVFLNEKQYKEALACFLLAKAIHIQAEDTSLKTTESNLENLKEELGDEEFEKLEAEVAPRTAEIVKNILEGTSI